MHAHEKFPRLLVDQLVTSMGTQPVPPPAPLSGFWKLPVSHWLTGIVRRRVEFLELTGGPLQNQSGQGPHFIVPPSLDLGRGFRTYCGRSNSVFSGEHFDQEQTSLCWFSHPDPFHSIPSQRIALHCITLHLHCIIQYHNAA